MKTKICTKCKVEKLLNEFTSHKTTRDRRQSWCKLCTSLGIKDYCKTKPINQYDLNNDFIKTWKSAREIERILGFAHSNISAVCSGKQKTGYGFIWKMK